MWGIDIDGSGWGVLGIDLDGCGWRSVGYRFRWEWVDELGIDLDGSGWGCWV